MFIMVTGLRKLQLSHLSLEALVSNRINGLLVIDDNWNLVGVVLDYDLLAIDTISGGKQRQSDASLFPDVDSSWKMMNNKEILYHEKRIGNIPGIEVGYLFYSRAEMVAVGFHSHWLNDIDYMGQSYSKTPVELAAPLLCGIPALVPQRKPLIRLNFTSLEKAGDKSS